MVILRFSDYSVYQYPYQRRNLNFYESSLQTSSSLTSLPQNLFPKYRQSSLALHVGSSLIILSIKVLTLYLEGRGALQRFHHEQVLPERLFYYVCVEFKRMTRTFWRDKIHDTNIFILILHFFHILRSRLRAYMLAGKTRRRLDGRFNNYLSFQRSKVSL